MSIDDHLQSIRSAVYRRITGGDIPEIFWHYTSQSGALGIVESRSIWATDIRFLNDEQEFAYTVSLADTILRSAPRTRLTSLIADTWPTMLTYMNERRFFVASFCRQGDVLSQWRAYSGGSRGIAIGFDATAMMLGSPRGSAVVIRCVYDEAEQRAIISELVDSFESVLDPPGASSSTEIESTAAAFFQTLHILATAFKHPGFMEEQEFRIAIQSTDTVTHRLGRVGITPYVRLPLNVDGAAQSIREVIVGPTPHSTVAVEGAKSWLRAAKIPAVVRGSRIPHRDW